MTGNVPDILPRLLHPARKEQIIFVTSADTWSNCYRYISVTTVLSLPRRIIFQRMALLLGNYMVVLFKQCIKWSVGHYTGLWFGRFITLLTELFSVSFLERWVAQERFCHRALVDLYLDLVFHSEHHSYTNRANGVLEFQLTREM